MKTTQLRLTFLSIAVIAMFSFNASAQTTPPATSSAPAKTQTQKPTEVKKAEPKMMSKEEFTKHYNEIQPKVKDFTAKAGTEKNAEFTTETTKLNTMVNDFKTKLDRYDSTPAAQREEYSKALGKDWDAISAQQKKVEGMWSKMHPGKTEKEAPKTATPK